MRSGDELGDLARSFDTMTERLLTVTVSKDRLQEEVKQRELAENALRESEERWATTLSSIGDAVMATDSAGNVTFMNPVAESLTGWMLAEASMKPVTEIFNIVNEQTRKEVESPVTRVLREGTIVGLANHTILVRKGGTEVPIDDSGAPIRDGNGKSIGVVLVFRDITERKRTEEALRESEARYRNVLRYAPAAIYEVDFTTGHFTEVNDGMCQMLGYTREEILAMTASDILDPEGRAHFASRISRARSGEKPDETVEYRGRTKDGRLIWVLLNVAFRWNDGRIVGATVVGHDVTERKQAEERLKESRARLDLALQSASMGAWHWDLIEDRRFFDDQTCSLLGIEPATFTGAADEFFGAVHPDDREMLKAALARTIEQDVLYEPEYRAVWPDGERPLHRCSRSAGSA